MFVSYSEQNKSKLLKLCLEVFGNVLNILVMCMFLRDVLQPQKYVWSCLDNEFKTYLVPVTVSGDFVM